MLVGALSACHMLWYLHLYSDAGVMVTTDSDAEVAACLHEKAGADCFIARSVDFPVEHRPEIVRATS